MHENYSVDAQELKSWRSRLFAHLRNLFSGNQTGQGTTDSGTMDRRTALKLMGSLAAGAVLVGATATSADAQVIEPGSGRFDIEDFTPDILQNYLLLRKIISESSELLAQHPALFYPVGSEIALPDSFFDNIDMLDLQLFEGQLVAKIALEPLQQMLQNARDHLLSPKIISGYRSYEFQKDTVYEPELLKVKGELQSQQANTGLSETELALEAEKIVSRYSSKQGHSQHHLGVAFDIVDGDHSSFDYAREHWDVGWYSWLRAHAHEYGFVLSYPRGIDNDTAKRDSGYTSSEPWHVRFVGKPLAQYLHQQDYLSADTTITAQSVLFTLHSMSQYGYK